MDKPTCRTCQYWNATKDDERDDEALGKCRFAPKTHDPVAALWMSLYLKGEEPGSYPSPLTETDSARDAWQTHNQHQDDQSFFIFPTHYASDWCGQHPDFPQYIEASRSARKHSKRQEP